MLTEAVFLLKVKYAKEQFLNSFHICDALNMMYLIVSSHTAERVDG